MQELFIAREGKIQLHWTYKRMEESGPPYSTSRKPTKKLKQLRVGTSHQLRTLLKRRQLQKRAGHRGQENDKIGAHAGWKMREKSYAQVD